MAIHNEKQFEIGICEYLEQNLWLYSPDASGYDKQRALFPEDLFGWLQDTQPDELAKVVKAGDPNEVKQRAQLLDRLRSALDKPHEQGGGTINLLRNGFAHINARFRLAQFQPENRLNEATNDRYEKVRVRVVRQVFYSSKHTGSIDLVLFVNGIPVATLELKTDFTQSVEDAIVIIPK